MQKLFLVFLGILFFVLAGCEAIIDAFVQEPHVVISYKAINKTRTGQYQDVVVDSLPFDAVFGRYYNGKWHATVPVYEVKLKSSATNNGSDGALNVVGHVSIYKNDNIIQQLNIHYTTLLPSGYEISNTTVLDIEDYDHFKISLSYSDANTEEPEDCDCCCDGY